MDSVVKRVDEADHGCSKRCHAEGRQYVYLGGCVDVLCMNNDFRTSCTRISVGEGGVVVCVRRG